MKKSTILFLLLVFFGTLQAGAANAPISTIGTVRTNLSTVVVPITAVNFTNVRNCDLRILFDPSVVNCTQVTANASMGLNVNWSVNNGALSISWYKSSPVNLANNSTIFNLTFTKVANGTSALTFDDSDQYGMFCRWGDGNFEGMNDIPTSTYYINGSLSMGLAPVTTAPVITACPVSNISVPVKVSYFNNIGNVALKLDYNSSVLTYQSWTNTSGFSILSVNGSTPGTILVTSTGNYSTTGGMTYPDNTVLLTLNFQYNGGTTALTWNDNGTSCQYKGPSATYPVLLDTPTATYYVNGTVEQLLAPGIIKNPNVADACISSPVSATFSSGSGGTTPQDYYESSTDAGSTWSSYTPGDPLTALTTGTGQIQIRTWRTSTGTSCTNSGYTYANWNIGPASAGGTLAGDTAVCSGDHSVTMTLSGYAGNILVWQYSTDSLSWSDIANTNPTYIAEDLTATTFYRVLVKNGVCDTVSSSAVKINVNPLLPVSVLITAGTDPVCAGGTVTYTASVTNGGSAPVYSWKINGDAVPGDTDSYSYAPASGDTVECIVVSNATCATGNPATGTFYPVVNPLLPVSLQIRVDHDTVCAGTLITFEAIPVNGGPSPAYEWFVNGESVSSAGNTYAYTPAIGDTVTCEVTSDATCPTGNPASASYYPLINPLLPVSLSIVAHSDSVCAGTSVTYAALPVNGGLLPSYAWSVNGGAIVGTDSIFSYIPQAGDTLTCTVVSSEACTTGNPASAEVYPVVYPLLPVSVQITAEEDTVCAGSSMQLAVVPVNGGIHPAYAWHVNGLLSGTDSTFVYTPLAGDTVVCYVTSSEQCTSGNPASAEFYPGVNPLLPVSLTISASADTICAGTAVTYTANPVNGGTAPVFAWYINGELQPGADIDFSYTPEAGDTIRCVVTSDAICPTGNPAFGEYYPVVNPLLPVSVEVISGADPVCAGTEVTYTANPVNGGTNPSYDWYVNHVIVGGSGNQYSYPPVAGDTITCVIHSSEICVSGNPATGQFIPVVNPLLPVSVEITASADSLCAGVPVTYTAIATNGGVTPAYAWHVNNGATMGSDSTFTYTPEDGDTVSCVVTSSETCTSGNPATGSYYPAVRPLLPVSATISASADSVCEGTSVTYTVHPVNGGTGVQFEWFINGGSVAGTDAQFTYIPAVGDTVKCKVTSSETCAIDNPFTTEFFPVVHPLLPVSIGISASANPVCAGTTVTYLATAINGGHNPEFTWNIAGGDTPGSQSAYIYEPSAGDTIQCSVTSSLKCTTNNPASAMFIPVVNPQLPVSLTITASADTICLGSEVTYTAQPVNGGGNPSYAWYVDGVGPAGTSDTYTYIPGTGDTVTCVLTSDATCPTGNPATASYYPSIKPPAPVSVTITASSDSVCAGTLVTYTANPVNGGSVPQYEWRVNGGAIAGTGADYSYTPAPGDVITCQLNSDIECATGNPASDSFEPVVFPLVSVSVQITAETNPVCAGESVKYSAVVTHGGLNPFYSWSVSGGGPVGSGSEFEYIPQAGDTITCTVLSDEACVSENPASDTFIPVVNPLNPVSVVIGASDDTICAGTTITYTAHVTNGGAFPVFAWYVNHVQIPATSASYTYEPQPEDTISCMVTSDVECPTGNPATASYYPVVNPSLPVSVNVHASADTVCAGTSVTYTAQVVNGGDTPVYEWHINGQAASGTESSYTYSPSGGDLVECVVTSNATCASGSPATGAYHPVVNPVLNVSVSVNASADPVCEGTTVSYSAVPVNGGDAPAYEWYVNEVQMSETTNVFSYIPIAGDTVTCVLVSSVACPEGNPASGSFYPTVNPLLPVSVELSAGEDNICAGTVVTYTAEVVNGGALPTYAWYINHVQVPGTLSTYSYAPQPGDTVSCVVTSNVECPGGNPATGHYYPTVHPLLPVSVTILASADTVCAGTSVTYTASLINGGSSPVFAWTVNGGSIAGTGNTFTYTPGIGDHIECAVISDALCASGNPATDSYDPVVNPVENVNVIVSASDDNVCAGTIVTYTAIPFYGGDSPVYQWYVNGNPVGANEDNYSYAPQADDTVTCVLTSDIACPAGNPATGSYYPLVNPLLPVGVNITASADPVCEGTTVTYTANVTNGGTAPVYEWHVNGGAVAGIADTYTYVPADGDLVTCIVTSDETCATGNPATGQFAPVVNPKFVVSVSVEADADTVCQGVAVGFTAIPVNGGISPQYQWRVNSSDVPGATHSTFSYVPDDQDVVTVSMTSSETECITGNPAVSEPVVVTVHSLLPVSVIISPDANPVCEGAMVTMDAFPVNGGSTPSFRWFVNSAEVPGETGSTLMLVPADGDVVQCEVTSSEACVSGNPAMSDLLTLYVNASAPVSVTISADQNPVCSGQTVNFTSEVSNGGTSPTYQWKVNGVDVDGAVSPFFSYIPVNNDAITCVVTSDAACATGNPATSDTITVSVLPVSAAGVSIAVSSNPVCSSTPVDFTATPTHGGAHPVYQWYLNNSLVPGATNATWSHTPVNGDLVRCEMISDAPCVTGNPAVSNSITMTVNPRPVPVITGSSSVCVGSTNLTYTATLGMTGYTWTISAGGTIVTTFQNKAVVNWNGAGSQWIRVNYTDANGCTALNPTQYNVTVNPLPVPTLTGSTTVCVGTTGVVYTTESGKSSYVWTVSAGGTKTAGGTSTSPTMTVTWHTAGPQTVSVSYRSGSCTAATPTVLNVDVLTPVTVSVINTVSANPVDAGQSVTFDAIPVNEGTAPQYQWHLNGAVYPGATNSSFTYTPANNDQVYCVVTSSLPCVLGNPATSNTITMEVIGMPSNLTVQDVTVHGGETECFNATDTITVAGGSSTFIVNNGGSATFIAGKAIFYLPGTKIDSGGYMLGKIAPGGPFCDSKLPTAPGSSLSGGKVDSPVSTEGHGSFRVYPNPTNGAFTLLQTGERTYATIRVEISNIRGETVLQKSLAGDRKHEFDLSDAPTGLYFVRIIADDHTESIKLIRTK